MNKIETKFDYSIVDDKVAAFLKLKEQEMQTIVLNSSVQLGERLIEAQEKLANYKTGTFEKWFNSIGLKKQTVYNYINQAKFVHQMDEYQQIEMFQELPTTLKTQISKPSAEPEAVEAVMNGDIKTTREYLALEKQLKAKDTQILQQARMIENLGEQETQVIEKEVVIEKIPDDYEFYKNQNETLRSEIKGLEDAIKNAPSKEEVERLKVQLSAKRKIENDELEQAQLKRLQRDADINVHKLILDMNNFIKEQAVTVYDSQAISGATQETKEKLNDAINRIENLLKDIKQEIGGEVTWIIN